MLLLLVNNNNGEFVRERALPTNTPLGDADVIVAHSNDDGRQTIEPYV
jgi:hypothetical protein